MEEWKGEKEEREGEVCTKELPKFFQDDLMLPQDSDVGHSLTSSQATA